MNTQEEIIGQFIRLIESTANKKMKKIDFGRDFQLYRGEIHLIKALGDHPGLSISDISRYFGVSRAVVSKNIGKLEKQGYVKKLTDEQRKNRLLILLTDLGQKAYLQHQSFHEQNDAYMFEFLGTLDEKELKAVSKFLDCAQRMIQNHF